MTTAYSTTTDIYYVRDGVGGVWLVPAELLVRDPDPLAWALLYGDTHTDSSAAELAEPVHNATTKGNSCPDG